MSFLYDPFLMYILVVLRQQCRFSAGCDSNQTGILDISLRWPLVRESGILQLLIERQKTRLMYLFEK